jgi:hypothetical protein
MSTGPGNFRQADLARALKAAKQAKVKVRVEIEPGNKIKVTMLDDKDAEPAAGNEWHERLGLK